MTSRHSARPAADRLSRLRGGTRAEGKDLATVVEGVARLHNLMKAGGGGELEFEDTPGSDVTGDVSVAQFIRDCAWGHHASCTCKIGTGPDAVLTSDFRRGPAKCRGARGRPAAPNFEMHVIAFAPPRLPAFPSSLFPRWTSLLAKRSLIYDHKWVANFLAPGVNN